MRHTIKRWAREESLTELMNFVVEHAGANGLDQETLQRLELATEEFITNVTKYAYNPDPGEIEISVERSDGGSDVIISFIDEGKSFDPTQQAEPDTTASLEEREVGGLGIYLIKKMFPTLTYTRRGDKNVVSLVVRVNHHGLKHAG